MRVSSSVKLAAIAVAVVSFSLAGRASADVIAAWQFTAVQTAPPALNTLPATSGSGTASELGMANAYTYNGGEGPGCSAANCDINVPVTGDPEVGWRIRGNSNSKNAGAGNANGWNLSAPQYTQGTQFSADTTGETGITVTYDWTSTNQGVKDMQPQYTIDGTTWINYSSGVDSGVLACPPGAWQKGLEMDLSGIPAVGNDPNFGIRLVSAYDPLTGGTSYSGASGGTYNNSSGNWGFNNVVISGTAAVPEPTTLALLVVAAVGLLACIRRRRPS